MSFLDLAKERYSVRKYQNRPVEETVSYLKHGKSAEPEKWFRAFYKEVYL